MKELSRRFTELALGEAFIIVGMFAVAIYAVEYVHINVVVQTSQQKQEQNKLAVNIKTYLNFLCSELKIPLQLIANAIESLDLRILDKKGQLAANKIIGNIHEVKIIADNLLLLINIEEGRFQPYNNNRVNFLALFDQLVVHPLSPLLDTPADWLTCSIADQVSDCYTDSFVISAIMVDIFSIAMQISSSTNQSKFLSVYIEVDTLTCSLIFTLKILGDADHEFLNSTLSKSLSALANACGGFTKIGHHDDILGEAEVSISISCLLGPQIQLDEQSEQTPLSYEEKREDKKESSAVVANLLVYDTAFVLSAISDFEKLNVECHFVSSIDEANTANILILDEWNARTYMHVLVKLKALVVLLSSNNR